MTEILIPIPVVVTPGSEAASEPLTPEGNLSLVDDAFIESIGEKQFITVETKNGNYFHIVIDHSGHTENDVENDITDDELDGEADSLADLSDEEYEDEDDYV
ncbi:MAG: DUF4366 domain-containing protein [Oscillospiraceae bacterium]|nr:DUF4366 domain-containing protein [Oscillospiraceae bacterium]